MPALIVVVPVLLVAAAQDQRAGLSRQANVAAERTAQGQRVAASLGHGAVAADLIGDCERITVVEEDQGSVVCHRAVPSVPVVPLPTWSMLLLPIVVVSVYVLLPVSTSVPAPAWLRLPVPVMSLPTVLLLLRLKTRAALSVTAPLPSVPAVVPLPTCSVPLLIVVLPVAVGAGQHQHAAPRLGQAAIARDRIGDGRGHCR